LFIRFDCFNQFRLNIIVGKGDNKKEFELLELEKIRKAGKNFF
jgi:hypothetical protein